MLRFCMLFFAATLMLGAKDSKAGVVVDFNPNPLTVIEGTILFTFDIDLSQMADEAFNGFTLAFGVGNDGATRPVISSFSTAGGILDGTDFTSSINAGGLGQSEILINFSRGPGNTDVIPANGTLASITLDMTGTRAGQSFLLEPNFMGASAVFDGAGNAIALVTPQARSLNVTAVPEPSAFLLIGLIGSIVTGRVYFRSRRKSLTT